MRTGKENNLEHPEDVDVCVHAVAEHSVAVVPEELCYLSHHPGKICAVLNRE